MDNKALNAAIARLVDFMASDEDMKKMTQRQLQRFLELANHAIFNYAGSVSLQDVKAIKDTVPEVQVD